MDRSRILEELNKIKKTCDSLYSLIVDEDITIVYGAGIDYEDFNVAAALLSSGSGFKTYYEITKKDKAKDGVTRCLFELCKDLPIPSLMDKKLNVYGACTIDHLIEWNAPGMAGVVDFLRQVSSLTDIVIYPIEKNEYLRDQLHRFIEEKGRDYVAYCDRTSRNQGAAGDNK